MLIAALVAQAVVIIVFFASDIGFLWYNVLGCGIVVVVSFGLEVVGARSRPQRARQGRR